MYIPTMASDKRNSAGHIQSTDNLYNLDNHVNRLRWSSNHEEVLKRSENKIKYYEE
jgi:hypothetical protein